MIRELHTLGVLRYVTERVCGVPKGEKQTEWHFRCKSNGVRIIRDIELTLTRSMTNSVCSYSSQMDDISEVW